MEKTIPSAAVSVFQFLDAREFLREACLAEKRRNRAFSQRYIARAMGEKSSSFLQDVLSGKSRLSPARVLKFARLLKLSREAAAHFENLALYTQAEAGEEKRRALEKLKAADPSGKHTLLEAFHREYFGKWHYAAVRELLAVHDFRGDFEELGRLLNPLLSAAEAREAVDLLYRLRLIRKTVHGGYAPTDRVVLSGPRTSPAQIRPALLGHLDLARRALDAFPVKKRPFSYATLSVSEGSARKIHEKFLAFRREVFDLIAGDADVDRLYQMNFQFFPLSETIKRRKK